MLTLGLAVVLVGCIYGVFRLSTSNTPYRVGWPGVWRLACVIAALRLTALWLGSAGLRRADWLQVPGYLLLMFDLPEIYLVKGVRNAPDRWVVLSSLILAVTSLAWAAAFFWVWNRLRAKAEPQH